MYTGNIEGMPPHLRMVYVQHDDASDDFGIPLIDEIMAGKDMIEANVAKEDVLKALRGKTSMDIFYENHHKNCLIMHLCIILRYAYIYAIRL
jgi:hypothetical protein